VKGNAATGIMQSEGYDPHGDDHQTGTMKIRLPLTGI
jgi:hypothetical protein